MLTKITRERIPTPRNDFSLHYCSFKALNMSAVLAVCFVFTLSLSSLQAASLIAHWSLDAGTGSVASDSGPNSHDGNLVGGPTWNVGLNAGGMDFDGSDDHVNVGNPANGDLDFTAGESFSFALWIKLPTSLSAKGYMFSKEEDGLIGSGYRVEVATNGRVHVGISDGFNYHHVCGGSTASLLDSEWHHVAFVADRTAQTATLFVDGVQVRQKSIAGFGDISSTKPFYLGRKETGYFQGRLDDVRIYSGDLTSSEIVTLATLPPSSSYGVYSSTNFPDPGAPEADPEADFDGDGVTNILEYAFGTDPTVMDAEIESTELQADGLETTIVYRKDGSGVEYIAEWCLDLDDLSWTPVTGPEVSLGGGLYKKSQPMGVNETQFMRLRVETVP